MTTLSASPSPSARRQPSPVITAAKLQANNRNTFVWVPLIVLGGAFLVTVAIWIIIQRATQDGLNPNIVAGAIQAPLWYLLVVGVQSVTLTFPFSQALSITRRDFYLGSLLTFTGFAAVFAAAMYGLGLLERATGGWWLGGSMFVAPGLAPAGHPAYLVAYFVATMVALNLGFAFGTIFKRGHALGLIVSIVGVVAILLLAAWLITQAGGWPTIGRWFLPPESILWKVSGIGAIVAVASGLLSWALIRRTPA